MTLDALRTRTSEDCLSDRRLDALLAGELAGEGLTRAEAHLSGCARCSERRAALSADAATFLAAHPPTGQPRVAAPRVRPLRRSVMWWGTGLAAAAAILLFVQKPEGELRTKGSGSVGFFVRHGDNVRRGGPGEHVQPGDALRFVVTQRAPSFVAVLSRDAAGQATVYYPAARQALLVEPGVERPLDTSVILDDVLGTELLYALRCEQSIELAPLKAELARTSREPAWPGGCEVERITLLKVWPP